MSTILPIQRSTRRRDYLATEGQTVFNLDVPVWDLLDVVVFSRLDVDSDGAWSSIPAAGNWSAAYLPSSPTVSVTFLVTPRPPGGAALWIRVESARVQDRTTDATRGGVMVSSLTERDFDTIATVLQELRRDINDASTYEYIADAQAAAAAAQDAQAAAAASQLGAGNSANQAAASATSAHNDALGAANASNAAQGSATSAGASQASAANAANTAVTSATSAANSANAAAASATAAQVAKMNWRGGWVTGTAYKKSDTVAAGGSSWIAKLDHTADATNAMPNPTYWDLVAQKGDKGDAGGSGGGGSGNVTGPASSTPGHVALFSSTNGQNIGDGGALANVAFSGNYGDLAGRPNLAPIATSSSYTDLANLPAAIDALDALTPAADRLPYFSGANAAALATFSAFARTVVDDADGPTMRTTIGAETYGQMGGVNTQANAAYNLAATDMGQVVEMNNAGANTVTIQPNATTAIPLKSRVDIVQFGAGQTTIVAAAGVTIHSKAGLKFSGQYAAASLYKRGTDDWMLFGDLTT